MSDTLSGIPRPEHPRPDFERAGWLNLNGEWQFEIDGAGDGERRGLTSGKDLARKILVPFCPESRLSGISHTEFMADVWYRRFFEVPAAMQGKRLLLHFGAVDWHARVWVNGKLAGEHKGGYSSFAFEITGLVRDSAPVGQASACPIREKGKMPAPQNEIVLHAIDNTIGGFQATGKQSQKRDSHGCVYTRTTGIWQTVWLEAVGETYLREFALTPDLDGGRLFFQGWTDGPGWCRRPACKSAGKMPAPLMKGAKVRLRAYAGDELVGEETVPAAWRSTLGVIKLSQVKPWRVGKPFLYGLTIEIFRGKKVVDSVRTYFGLRKITLEGNRFLINDKPVFQRLVLDQGFYPDGIYTAPTDGDLRRDIEISMAAGFNGARLHQKVFEPRLLYWADKLGYLLWGEYPNWGINHGHHHAVAQAVHEWREVLRRDRNHPSIVGWCPLNETYRAEDVATFQLLLAATQTMDPTRAFLDTSGYVHFIPETDVFDCHDYQQDPAKLAARFAEFKETAKNAWSNDQVDPRSAYRGQPYFVSEYGGIRIETGRDIGAGWGYGGESLGLEKFFERYKALTDVLLDNPHMFGFCYTQLTDIEQEQNGIVFYDRQLKYDLARLKAINARPAAYEM